MFINSLHVAEWFRLISGAPLLLLIGIDISQRLVRACWPRATTFARAAIVVSSMPVGIIVVKGFIVRHLVFQGRPRSLVLPYTKGIVERVTYYDPAQIEFYEAVRGLCQMRSNLINVTGDVLITRACALPTKIVFGGMVETILMLEKKRPELNARVFSYGLYPDEIMFSYGFKRPLDTKATVVAKFPNLRADIYAIPIEVDVGPDVPR